MIGTLTGTLRNITIETHFYWQCSRSNGENQYVGGVIGRITNGTVENVNLIVGSRPSSASYSFNMVYTGRPTAGS